MRPIAILALGGVMLSSTPTHAETRILAYGDSNTWGWIPIAEGFPAERLSDADRWGGVLETALEDATGDDATVVVDGMVGRRTDLDGAANGAIAAADFNGAADLPEAIARAMPLDAVVIMLGTNDLQAGVERAPAAVADAVVAMAQEAAALDQPLFSSYAAPAVLIVAPPAFGDTSATGLGGLFGAGEAPSRALGIAFADAAAEAGVPVFDASTVVAAVGVDGIHMTAEGHAALGRALAPILTDLLEN